MYIRKSLLILILLASASCRKQQVPEPPGPDLFKIALSDFAKKNDANIDWLKIPDKDLEEALGKPFGPPVFTLDLQNALQLSPRIAFVGVIVDVQEQADEYVVRAAYPNEILTTIIFLLTADETTIKPVLKDRGSFVTHAIAAECFEVHRFLLSASAYSLGDYEHGFSEEAEIYASVSDAPFLVKGKLVAIEQKNRSDFSELP